LDLPEEGMAAMENATSKYNEASETTQYWFLNEVQNTFVIDGTLNMEMIYLKSAEIIKRNTKKMQDYLMNVLLGILQITNFNFNMMLIYIIISEKPSTLEGTCPLTSQIPLRLSPEFGFYCPVALNERDELIRVNDVTDLSEVVEHKGHVYLFSSPHNARKFLAKPDKYIPPTCKRTPPKDFPTTCILTPAEFEKLKCHWGFMDFDPVRYFDANQK
jgi:YHS domain-containing protein